jgi:hypothetical protein
VTESAMPRTSGRTNIAYTLTGEQAARRLVDHFPFAGLQDVARVATAFALRENLSLARPEDFGSANGSNAHVGSVDPQGELKDLLLALHPEIDEDPYRVIETLMSVGAIELDRRVATGQILSLRDLIGDLDSPEVIDS